MVCSAPRAPRRPCRAAFQAARHRGARAGSCWTPFPFAQAGLDWPVVSPSGEAVFGDLGSGERQGLHRDWRRGQRGGTLADLSKSLGYPVLMTMAVLTGSARMHSPDPGSCSPAPCPWARLRCASLAGFLAGWRPVGES